MPQTEPAMASKETVLLPIRHAPYTKLRDILQLKTVAELRSLAGLHGVRRIYQLTPCWFRTAWKTSSFCWTAHPGDGC